MGTLSDYLLDKRNNKASLRDHIDEIKLIESSNLLTLREKLALLDKEMVFIEEIFQAIHLTHNDSYGDNSPMSDSRSERTIELYLNYLEVVYATINF